MEPTTYNNSKFGLSPWTKKQRIAILLWSLVWPLFCGWTPKPLSPWRVFWLRRFGAKIHGRCFVHQRARITNPWNIVLHDFTCVGDGAHLYALGLIEVRSGSVLAQDVYVCTGTHDFSDFGMPLITSPVIIHENVFVGAGAFIMPGVEVGAASVVGARSVVTKSIPAQVICAGNPARVFKQRILKKS